MAAKGGPENEAVGMASSSSRPAHEPPSRRRLPRKARIVLYFGDGHVDNGELGLVSP